MIRLALRLLFWPAVLALLLLACLPFTVTGTRWLLAQAEQLAPLTLEYAGGTLAGELALERLAWSGESTRLELSGVSARLDRACLWRSVICLQDLVADELVVEVLAASPEEVGNPDDVEASDVSELLVLPVSIEAPGLKLSKLRVAWDGGEWRQGSLSGSVALSGSAIQVDRAVIREAFLQLAEAATSEERAGLPEINLPLDLQVEDLSLEQPGWDVYGAKSSLQSLRLGSGNWKNKELWLSALQVNAGDPGAAVVSGKLEFSGQWPVAVTLDGFPAARPEWPDMLERHVRVDASGELSDLALEVTVGGKASLVARGQLDALDPSLPFSLAVDMDWPEQLVLAQQFAVPEELSDVALRGPLVLSASGTLAEQVFQLQMSSEVPGYELLNLHVAGRHKHELLSVEDLRIEDVPGANTLWAAGELRYGEQLQWSLQLESSGLDLSPINENLRGRLQGQLQLDGRVAGTDWALTLSDVNLEGEVNKLPARISGFAGLDSDLRLLPSRLEADFNGAILLMESAAGHSGGGHLELAVDELARWLPGGRGTLELQIQLMEGWQEFALDGSLRELQWRGVQANSGKINGQYHGNAGRFTLDLTLADVNYDGLDLQSIDLGARGDSSTQTFSLGSKGELDGELLVSGHGDRVSGWSGQLAATSLQTPEGTWHLGEPVAVNFRPEPAGLMVAAHCWHYQQSRVCPGELLLAEQGTASVEMTGGLAILSAFLPEYLVVTGELDARLQADWAPGEAIGLSGDVKGRDFVITRYFGGGESGSARWDSLAATLVNSEQGLDLNSDLVALDGRHARLALRLPADRSRPLDGTLSLEGLQLGMLAPFFPSLAALEGELAGDLQLAGTLDQPLAEGSLQFSRGRFALLGNPTELQDLDLLLQAQGDRLSIDGRGLLGGGELEISGVLLTRPQWRLELALTGGKHELLIPPYTQMLVSEQLQLLGSGNQLDLRGEIIVHEGTLEHERLPEGSVGLSDDVVEVDIHGDVVSEVNQFLTSMNIQLKLEDKFRVTGDMVNVALGGDLQLLQNPGKPVQLFGSLNVIGGELRAYQQHLRIRRGSISFTGNPENPQLDVRAQRAISTEKVVVGIQLQGTLQQPRLDVYSDPPMSHADTMSYLIRGRAVDTGAGSDGAVMALTMGTGLVNQSELVAELNRIPGINNVAFGAEGNAEDAAATVGGYIGERLYLSYGLGIYEPINVLTARLYLQTRLWLEVVSRLENSVDLYYSFDIN